MKKKGMCPEKIQVSYQYDVLAESLACPARISSHRQEEHEKGQTTSKCGRI
jgi:hypothetical protein